MIILEVLLYAYIALIVCICIIASALLLGAGLIAAGALLLAPFRRPRGAPVGSQPLWGPQGTNRHSDVERARREIDRRYGLPASSTYTFEHDGPRPGSEDVSRN